MFVSLKGLDVFFEFFALLKKKGHQKLFRFHLVLEMAVLVLTSPWSRCKVLAVAKHFMPVHVL